MSSFLLHHGSRKIANTVSSCSSSSSLSSVKSALRCKPLTSFSHQQRRMKNNNHSMLLFANNSSISSSCQQRSFSTLTSWVGSLFGGQKPESIAATTTTNTDGIQVQVASVVKDASSNNNIVGTTNTATTNTATNTTNTVDTTAATENAVVGNGFDDFELPPGLQYIHETADYEYHAPLTFGEEHELFVGGHLPHALPHINVIQDLLQFFHENLGLPWFGCIMACTVAFRLLVLPLNISLTRNSARLDSVRPHLHEQSEIMASKEATEAEKLEAADKFQSTIKEQKCHPMFNILSPLVMAPMFLSVFVSVERICLHDPGCRGAGGLWWFPDLSSIDPTMTLPVISAVSWLISVEMGAAEPRTETMRQVRSVMRFVAAVMVPITGALPSGVFVYWITSNIFSMIQIYVMRMRPVRKFFNIPTKDATAHHHVHTNRDISM